jgi:pantoate--beta-alanine ligase
VAPELFRAMKETAAQLRAGAELSAAVAAGSEIIRQAGFALDYLEVRHAETLAPVASIKDGPLRILVAAKIGTTRLIDNVAV